MNAPRKKSAIVKYTGVPIDEVPAALAADEKGYTADEQAEILAALQEPGEQTNTATTDIIPDTLVSQPSGRRDAKNIGDGATVRIQNERGNVNTLSREAALKLLKSDSEGKYKVVD